MLIQHAVPVRLYLPHGLGLVLYFTFYMLLLLLLRHFSRVRLCVTPEMAAHQSPPSLGFSSHKNNEIMAIYGNMDGPRDGHTE